MTVLKDASGGNWCAETVDFRSDDPHATLKLGVSKSAIAHRAKRGQTWALGQLYGVVAPGLIMVEHVFQGLRRPMSVNGDIRADEGKLAFTWSAKRDAQLSADGELRYVGAPVGKVFFVLASPNTETERFPEIFAWIETWGWLEPDATISGAPVDCDSRYDTRVWSR